MQPRLAKGQVGSLGYFVIQSGVRRKEEEGAEDG